MAEATVALSLSAAWLAGIAGSGHCLAMCGGLAGALGMRAQGATPARAFVLAGSHHLGRLGGYALAGAIAGTLGAGLQAGMTLMSLGPMLRMASAALLVALGLRLLLPINPLRWLESFGARIWQRLLPLARNRAQHAGTSIGNALTLGLLWGWLPCGLVYSMLLFAALSGGGVQGAGILLAFGAGTLPAMLTSTLLARQMQRLLAKRWPRLASGVLLVTCGLWMFWASMPHGSAHMHH